jgi:hypothetical protein
LDGWGSCVCSLYPSFFVLVRSDSAPIVRNVIAADVPVLCCCVNKGKHDDDACMQGGVLSHPPN